MNIEFEFKTSGETPDGFVAEFDGYMCFLEPLVISQETIHYHWLVQEGGEWTHRGGSEINTRAEGEVFSAAQADKDITLGLKQRVRNCNTIGL